MADLVLYDRATFVLQPKIPRTTLVLQAYTIVSVLSTLSVMIVAASKGLSQVEADTLHRLFLYKHADLIAATCFATMLIWNKFGRNQLLYDMLLLLFWVATILSLVRNVEDFSLVAIYKAAFIALLVTLTLTLIAIQMDFDIVRHAQDLFSAMLVVGWLVALLQIVPGKFLVLFAKAASIAWWTMMATMIIPMAAQDLMGDSPYSSNQDIYYSVQVVLLYVAPLILFKTFLLFV